MATNLNLSIPYNQGYVWDKFKSRNYPWECSEKLADVKAQAIKMTEYVLLKKKPSDYLYDACKAWMEKRKLTQLSRTELYAKVFSLSLKVVRQFKEFKGKLKVPKMLTTQEGDKQAPFIKLFGPKTRFYVLKTQAGNNNHGIVILNCLGEGSHNKAYLVYVLNQGENVLRVLKPKALEKTRLAQWTSDNHYHYKLLGAGIPGIVKLHQTYILNGSNNNPLMRSTLMEKCDGNLRELSQEIKDSEGKKIMLQILTIVSQMHAHGFVHGDLKSANFMYINSPEGVIVKLGDFETTERASLGISGTNTPEYVTPTGWLNKNIGVENTKKEDCFGLGIIALRLICGQISNPAVVNFRSRLLNSHVLEKLLNHLVKNKMDFKEFSVRLSHEYPNIPVGDFEKILDGNTIKRIKEGNIDSQKSVEIFKQFFNVIVEREFKPQWDQSMNTVFEYLLKSHSTPYHTLIAELLNLDGSKRISAQDALVKLKAIIQQDELAYS